MPASSHVRPLGFANGWLIDRPGSYTVVLDYGVQHVAYIALLISGLALCSALIWGLWPYLSQLRWGRRG
jgi:hypothetical protein